MHAIYIQQKSQGFEAAVQTGAYKGLALEIPSLMSYDQAARAIGALSKLIESDDIAYDPWIPVSLAISLPGQPSPVTLRRNASA